MINLQGFFFATLVWQIDLKVETENPVCASVPLLMGHCVLSGDSCTTQGFGAVLVGISPCTLKSCKFHSL